MSLKAEIRTYELT